MRSLLQDLFRACPEFMRHKVGAGRAAGAAPALPAIRPSDPHRRGLLERDRLLKSLKLDPAGLTSPPGCRCPALCPAGAAGIAPAAGLPRHPGGQGGAQPARVCGCLPRSIPQARGGAGRRGVGGTQRAARLEGASAQVAQEAVAALANCAPSEGPMGWPRPSHCEPPSNRSPCPAPSLLQWLQPRLQHC